jgi:hypothetical protein
VLGESAWSAAGCAVAPELVVPTGKSLFEFACDVSGGGATGAIALLCKLALVGFEAAVTLAAVELPRLAAGRIILGNVDAADSVPGPGLEK